MSVCAQTHYLILGNSVDRIVQKADIPISFPYWCAFLACFPITLRLVLNSGVVRTHSNKEFVAGFFSRAFLWEVFFKFSVSLNLKTSEIENLPWLWMVVCPSQQLCGIPTTCSGFNPRSPKQLEEPGAVPHRAWGAVIENGQLKINHAKLSLHSDQAALSDTLLLFRGPVWTLW